MSENNLSKEAFKNVLDLDAARQTKKMTGQAKAIRIDTGEPLSKSSEQHINDMLEMNKPPQQPKKSLLDKFGEKLGLFEE